VVDLPSTGADVFEKAAKVAQDDEAWKARDVQVDRETVIGHETVYEGMWVIYCAMPDVILYVLAPAAMRLSTIELGKFAVSEIPRREDWPE